MNIGAGGKAEQAFAGMVARLRRLAGLAFDVREQATADLLEMGGAAVSLLRRASSRDDVEITRRAERCLEVSKAPSIAAVPTESVASLSSVSAVTLRKDESSADRARVQQGAPHASKVARYASTRAFRARLNVMKVAGVVSPLNPGGKAKGKEPPPAARLTFAESNSPTI